MKTYYADLTPEQRARKLGLPSSPEKASGELDVVADKVLAYRPKPKSKPAKKRRRRQRDLRNV